MARAMTTIDVMNPNRILTVAEVRDDFGLPSREYLVLLFSQDGTLHVKLFMGCNCTVITGNYMAQ